MKLLSEPRSCFEDGR